MRLKERTAEGLGACGLPPDAFGDCARVTLLGRSCVAVEGQHGVIELSGERIRLRTGEGVLSVEGSELALKRLSPFGAQITGRRIDGVSYG